MCIESRPFMYLSRLLRPSLAQGGPCHAFFQSAFTLQPRLQHTLQSQCPITAMPLTAAQRPLPHMSISARPYTSSSAALGGDAKRKSLEALHDRVSKPASPPFRKNSPPDLPTTPNASQSELSDSPQLSRPSRPLEATLSERPKQFGRSKRQSASPQGSRDLDAWLSRVQQEAQEKPCLKASFILEMLKSLEVMQLVPERMPEVAAALTLLAQRAETSPGQMLSKLTGFAECIQSSEALVEALPPGSTFFRHLFSLMQAAAANLATYIDPEACLSMAEVQTKLLMPCTTFWDTISERGVPKEHIAGQRRSKHPKPGQERAELSASIACSLLCHGVRLHSRKLLPPPNDDLQSSVPLRHCANL
jgi:hypothetical protein